MIKRIAVGLIVVAFFTAIPTITAGTVLTPQQAIDTIISNNARIKAVGLSYKAATQSELSEAGSLEGPELEFERLYGPEGDKRWSLGVSQSFDWPVAYGKRKEAAKANDAVYTWLHDAEVFQLRQQVSELLTDLTYAEKRIAFANDIVNKIREISDYVNDGYKRGQLTILDVKKIALQQYSAKVALTDVEQEKAELLSKLTALNNGVPIEVNATDYIAEPLLDLNSYLAFAEKNNPSIKASLGRVEAYKKEAEALRASALPGFSVGYSHAYEDESHFNGFTIGLKLPFYSRKKAREAARYNMMSSSFDKAEELAQARSEVIYNYNVAKKRHDELEGLSKVTLDNSYPELLLMAYKGGQINVIDYMTELVYYIDARKDYLSAEYQLRLALVKLNKYNHK